MVSNDEEQLQESDNFEEGENSNRNQSRSAYGNVDDRHFEEDTANGEQRHQPIIAPGELNENINKRSESANRKYRAFKHFLKY